MVHGLHNRGLLDSQWVLFSHYPLYSTSRYWPEHTVMWIVSLKDIVFTVDLLSELNTLTFTFIAEFWHVLSAHIPSCALRLWMKGQPLSVCWRSQLNKSLIVKGNSEFIHLTQMCILYCDPSIWFLLRKIEFSQVWNMYWFISRWKFSDWVYSKCVVLPDFLSTCVGFFFFFGGG